MGLSNKLLRRITDNYIRSSVMSVFLAALLLVFTRAVCLAVLQEAPDGSVCFNGCNNHGDCVDYSCHCHVGYTGDDCGVSKYLMARANYFAPDFTLLTICFHSCLLQLLLKKEMSFP